MSLAKGGNVAVPSASVWVQLSWASGPDADATALLLGGNGKVRSDDDMVFYNQKAHPSGSVRHEGKQQNGGGAVDTLYVDLARVEPQIERVAIVASADSGTFRDYRGLSVRVLDGVSYAEIARFDPPDATVETAYVLGELYRRQGAWKFRAVGQGWDTGLRGLATAFGITVDDPAPTPAAPTWQAPPTPTPAAPTWQAPPAPNPAAPTWQAPPTPTPAAPTWQAPPPVQQPPPAQPPPAAPPVRLTKITLTKNAPTVSLDKSGASGGLMRVNLNWTASPRRGLFNKGRKIDLDMLDLDLCCLWEFQNGSAGAVAALGDFGSLDKLPYIALDADDRTGFSEAGENLTINLDHAAKFKRILVFVAIYEGARNFSGLDAVATLYPRNAPPIEVPLHDADVDTPVAAAFMIENVGGEMVVRRESRYVPLPPGKSPQRAIDEAYGWGLVWEPAPPKA